MLAVQMRPQVHLMKILYCLVTTSILNQITSLFLFFYFLFFFYFFQAEFFIYKCKINKTIPQLHLFKCYLKTNFEVYKYNAKLNKSYKIVTEWCPYQQLIDV